MKKCCKCGKEVENGYIICEDCLKPEKTADEMFADLGYEKYIDGFDGEILPGSYRKRKEYRDYVSDYDFTYISLGNDGVEKFELPVGNYVNVEITCEEIKAIAKKLEELGW